MRLKVLGMFANAYGTFFKGQIIDLPDSTAQPLIDTGNAELAGPPTAPVDPKRQGKIIAAIEEIQRRVGMDEANVAVYYTTRGAILMDKLKELTEIADLTGRDRDAALTAMHEGK